VIGVSFPQPNHRFDFSCFVSLPDRDDPCEIYGVDSLQCLSLGMRFASSRIDDLISKGWSFYCRDGDEEYEMEWSAYFMPQDVLDKLSAIGEKAIRSIESKTKESEAKQAFSGQPATRSESNSEGGDKPQPEAEGRSR